jgi:uncharacterized damage-inducible protein DinB
VIIVFTIQELYQYTSTVRRRFLDKLETLPWDVLVKNREASFYSIRNIFLHMIDNEDWIVNWVIRNKSTEYKRRKSDEYTDFAMLKGHALAVEGKTIAYLGGIDEAELQRTVKFILGSGESFDLSVEESLFQTLTEQLFHTGELIALLWQEDIEPPKMQWFNNNPRSKHDQKRLPESKQPG